MLGLEPGKRQLDNGDIFQVWLDTEKMLQETLRDFGHDTCVVGDWRCAAGDRLGTVG